MTNKSAVLSEQEVQEIRLVAKLKNKTQSQLAQEYGVGKSTINDVVNNRTWTSVPSPRPLKNGLFQLSENAIFSPKLGGYLNVSKEKATKKKYVTSVDSKGKSEKIYLS